MAVAEFFLERAVPDAEFKAGLAAVLAVPASSVAVVESIEALSTDAMVSAVVSVLAGDFRLRVEVYADDRILQRNEHVVAISVARRFSCSVLISDASVNPYSWLMVTSEGQVVPVLLEAESLDNGGAVKLLASVG